MRKIKHYFGKRRSKHKRCLPKWLWVMPRRSFNADYDGDSYNGGSFVEIEAEIRRQTAEIFGVPPHLLDPNWNNPHHVTKEQVGPDYGDQWKPWDDDSVVAVQEKQTDVPLIGKE